MSLGVALCWNSKDYWWPENIWQDLPSNISNLYCFNTVLHQGILQEKWTIDKSDMLFWFYTVLIWCLLRIHDILLVLYWYRDIWLQTEDNQQVISIPVIACEIWPVCIPIYRCVSVIFIAEFNFTVSFFDLYLYINTYRWNEENTYSNKEIYNEFRFTVLCHAIVILLAVLQWH